METKIVQIVSGSFATGKDERTGKDKQGNFTAYTVTGDRIFVHKNAMLAQKLEKDEDIKFPLFAVIGEKEISTRDEDGNILTDVKVKRLQALSIFTTKESALEAYTADTKLNISAKKDVLDFMEEQGLDQSAVDRLLALA